MSDADVIDLFATDSADRVRAHTATAVQSQLDRDLVERIRHFAQQADGSEGGRALLTRRLLEAEQDSDMERTLQATGARRHDPGRRPSDAAPHSVRFVTHAAAAGFLSVRGPSRVDSVTDAPLDLLGQPVPIPVPGHTAGHCAYLLPDRGLLFSGDTIVSLHAPR